MPLPLQALRGVAQGFDVYVDSVNGDDANSGRHPFAAKRTRAGIGTITRGMRIGLARGSLWREEFAGGTATGVFIGAYGSGAAPIIDGSDPVTPSEWAPTAGQANVYEVTRTALAEPSAQHESVWTDAGLAGVRASSLANCNATPGSFWSSFTAGGAGTVYKLYLHPAGSTDPRSNGVQYHVGARLYCVQLRNGVVRGVNCRRQLHHNGSVLVQGTDSKAEGLTAREGHIHDIYTEGGELSNCTTADTEQGFSVVFNPQAGGGSLLARNISATYAAPCTGPAFFIHGKENVTTLVDGFTADGSETGASSSDLGGKVVLNRFYHRGGSAGTNKRSFDFLQLYDPRACDLFMIRPRSINANFGLYTNNVSAGLRIFMWEPMLFNVWQALYLFQAAEVHVVGGLFYASSGVPYSVQDSLSRVNFTMLHTAVHMQTDVFYTALSGGTYTLDRNVYWKPAGGDQRWQFNGTGFIGSTGWANWRAAGRDVNSVWGSNPLYETTPQSVTTLAGMESMLDSSGVLKVTSASSPLVTVGAGPGRVPNDYVFPAWVPSDVRALCGRA